MFLIFLDGKTTLKCENVIFNISFFSAVRPVSDGVCVHYMCV